MSSFMLYIYKDYIEFQIPNAIYIYIFFRGNTNLETPFLFFIEIHENQIRMHRYYLEIQQSRSINNRNRLRLTNEKQISHILLLIYLRTIKFYELDIKFKLIYRFTNWCNRPRSIILYELDTKSHRHWHCKHRAECPYQQEHDLSGMLQS